MTGQGLGTQITVRLGRSGLRVGKQAALRVTGGAAWRKKGRALFRRTVQGEAWGSLAGSPVGRSGDRRDPSLVVAGPSSRCGGGRHRKGLHAWGCPAPSTHGSLNPFTVRDAGALRELTTPILPSSAQPQGWDSGGRVGQGEGLEKQGGGSRPARGGGPSRKTPPPH